MAAGMARSDNKRAASAYVIDEESAARADLSKAVADYSKAQAVPIGETIDKAAAIDKAVTIDSTTAAQTEKAAEPNSDIGATTAAVAEAALEAIGDIAGKAIETLASTLESLLGGGSSAPKPKRQPPPMTAKEQHAAEIKAFLAAERRQRAANMQEIATSLNASPALTPEQLEELQRSRDRGGGISR